jgi:hypothetical protein
LTKFEQKNASLVQEVLEFFHQKILKCQFFCKNAGQTKSFNLRTVKIHQHQPKGRPHTHSTHSTRALELKKKFNLKTLQIYQKAQGRRHTVKMSWCCDFHGESGDNL